MDNGLSPAPGIHKPGPRPYEVTDQEEKASQPSGRWELESSGPYHLGTPSWAGSFPPSSSSPPLLPLLLPQTSGNQDHCLCPGHREEAQNGERRKEGRVYDSPLISSGGLLVQHKESGNWGSQQSGGTHGLHLYQPGYLFPLLSLRGPGPAGGSPGQ